ncbi:hypothetical protein OF83DRAFT_1096686 [Amylostereum chailletii]|nr:hypothetical protein OF83DRAFT_1096686 [Amylostereum chailletii]
MRLGLDHRISSAPPESSRVCEKTLIHCLSSMLIGVASPNFPWDGNVLASALAGVPWSPHIHILSSYIIYLVMTSIEHQGREVRPWCRRHHKGSRHWRPACRRHRFRARRG